MSPDTALAQRWFRWRWRGEGRLCQAGHPTPLLVRAGGEAIAVGEGGMPVGLLYDCVDEVHYQQGRQENILTLVKRLPQAV